MGTPDRRLTSAALTREDNHDDDDDDNNNRDENVADGCVLARHAHALADCTDYLVDYAASSKTPKKAGGSQSRARLSTRR